MSNSDLNEFETLGDVSVLMTNFNKKQNLQAILKLSFELLSRDAELVIVDDGSTDGSYEELRTITKGRNGIILVSHPNQGSAFSRNRAISLASRKFVVFLDFDDSLSLDVLEEGIATLRNSTAQMAMLNYEINPGNSRNPMPVNALEPMIIEMHSRRNEIFRSMGYWRYLYRRDFIVSQKLSFTPTFKDIGGLFILDDLFWLLHNCSLETDILVFPEDKTLYFYDLGSPNQTDWLRYQGQVMLFPKAMTLFLNSLVGCEHAHDRDWLKEISAQIVFEHLAFLSIGQLFRTLPSYKLFLDSRDSIFDLPSTVPRINQLGALTLRSLKNSIMKYRSLRAAINYLKRR